MKLTDKILQRPDQSSPFFTLEFFPPRTDQGFSNLLDRISRLSTLRPLAISVTWGAGGSTRSRSLELAGLSQEKYGVETIMHLTCTNMEEGSVHEALLDAKERGIQNILALRGDPPRGSEDWIPSDPRFVHAIDLVKYIRSTPEFADFFCIGVAAYPDGHTDHLPEPEEMAYLKAKVDAGADYIVTQLFYDSENFRRWVGRVRDAGITVPILPGIMPIQSYSSFLRMTKLCGTKVPAAVSAALDPIKSDDQKVKDYGVELASSTISQIFEDKGLGIVGVHLCTLNLEKSVRRVLDSLGWSHETRQRKNLIIDEEPSAHHLPEEIAISPVDASQSAVQVLVHPPSSPSLPEISQQQAASAEVRGIGTTWDEFPNGRFGDPTSPAYGVGSGDQWDPGAGGLGVSRNEALAQWGSPTKISDLDAIFTRHLKSDPQTPTTPFSPEPLLGESATILPQLLKMAAKGWWTVGSQPAVDCASSTHELFGWGPAGGYVFQKAFVEFFCDEDTLRILEAKVKDAGGWVTWFAANSDDGWVTNLEDEGRNAVTWGVFPGQEIAQSTIIERTSFLAWKEEAFGIWSEWALMYPPESETRKLLEEVRDSRWLVSIVHHDFKDANALWKFLLS